MGSRILKDSINESHSLATLSIFAQDLFKRLITYADDYGRFNLDIDIMRARLYPLELDSVTVDQIDAALVDLVGVGKIGIYTARVRHGGDNKMYGLFPNWATHQRLRSTRAKCPDPEEEVNDWALQRFIPIALRERIMMRDRFTCQECRRDFSMMGLSVRETMRRLNGVLHIDHIVPVGQGGRATEENLRVLCASCNLSRPRTIPLHELARQAATQRTGEPLVNVGGSLPQTAADSGDTRPESESEFDSESERESKEKPPRPAPDKPATDYSPDFERFWTVYPRHLKKPAAFKQWRARLKGGVAPDDMIAAATHYASSCAQKGTEPEYIMHGSTFLGPNRPYEDWVQGAPEPLAAPRASPGRPLSQGDQNQDLLRRLWQRNHPEEVAT